MMIKRPTLLLGKTAMLGALLAAVAVGSTGAVAEAVQVPDQIRVALFVDLGSKYQSLTPVVTLGSTGAMKLSLNGVPVASAAAGQTLRFAVDGYRAKLLETADYSTAIAVLKKVQASSKAGFVTALKKNGKTVYQVTEGNYSTAAAAAAALTKWTNAGVTAGMQSLTAASVVGPWAVEAGPYASEAEASAALTRIGAAGLDAFLARKPANGSVAYYVRIGQASDPAGLEALQQAAAAAGQTARIPNAGDPYVVVRSDATSGTAAQTSPLYALPQSAGIALRVDPAGNQGIQVAERSKGTYRGSMEISVLNNNLALVNELPLEQYLYSVVGSEVVASWPLEAQKAQAVAARSYALARGAGFQIADVVDTTVSQTYTGMASENAQAIAAVDATAGEVLTYQGKIVEAVFSSNAGGITADNLTEAWGNDTPYLASAVSSPDAGPQEGKLDWYRVVLSSGKIGYIRSDLLKNSGTKNEAGIPLYEVTGNGVAVRPSPQISATAAPIATANAGEKVVVLKRVPEYTSYSWVEGPLTASQLLTSINKRAKTKLTNLTTLEVSKRGPSGRAAEIAVNGKPVDVGVPDNLRGALGGIRSTLFAIEETGRFTVLGANGERKEFPSDASSLQIEGANGARAQAGDRNLILLGAKGELRAATTTPEFIISGKGYGHGLGMSQWGAKGLADQGYDYQSILLYYYKNVKIEKDVSE